jgi:hypothetical protein
VTGVGVDPRALLRRYNHPATITAPTTPAATNVMALIRSVYETP